MMWTRTCNCNQVRTLPIVDWCAWSLFCTGCIYDSLTQIVSVHLKILRNVFNQIVIAKLVISLKFAQVN